VAFYDFDNQEYYGTLTITFLEGACNKGPETLTEYVELQLEKNKYIYPLEIPNDPRWHSPYIMKVGPTGTWTTTFDSTDNLPGSLSDTRSIMPTLQMSDPLQSPSRTITNTKLYAEWLQPDSNGQEYHGYYNLKVLPVPNDPDDPIVFKMDGHTHTHDVTAPSPIQVNERLQTSSGAPVTVGVNDYRWDKVGGRFSGELNVGDFGFNPNDTVKEPTIKILDDKVGSVTSGDIIDTTVQIKYKNEWYPKYGENNTVQMELKGIETGGGLEILSIFPSATIIEAVPDRHTPHWLGCSVRFSVSRIMLGSTNITNLIGENSRYSILWMIDDSTSFPFGLSAIYWLDEETSICPIFNITVSDSNMFAPGTVNVGVTLEDNYTHRTYSAHYSVRLTGSF